MKQVNDSLKRQRLHARTAARILWFCVFLTAVWVYLLFTGKGALLQGYWPWARIRPPEFMFVFDEAGLQRPRGITAADGRIYLADSASGSIAVFSATGKLLDRFGRAYLTAPYDVCVHDGVLYVTDHLAGKVQRFLTDGTFTGTLLESGANGLDLFLPTAITVSAEDGHFYITDIAGHHVVVCDADGEILLTFGGPGTGPGRLSYPGGVALDRDSNILVADSNNGRIQVFRPGGLEARRMPAATAQDGDAFALPGSIAVDMYGYSWVVDTFAHTVYVFDGAELLFSFGGFGLEEGKLYFPADITFDSDSVYITERALHRVSVFRYPAQLAAYTGR